MKFSMIAKTVETRGWTHLARAKNCLAAVAMLTLAGCAVGPNYKTPKTPVPASFANGSQTYLSTNQTVVDWWRGFDDAELNQLVERALAKNHDLRIATA